MGFDLTSNEQLKGYLPIQIMTPVIIDEDDFRVMKIEKRLKTFGLFETGGIKMGIRVNNPELRPGEDLSIKVSSLLRSFASNLTISFPFQQRRGIFDQSEFSKIRMFTRKL